MVIAIAAVMLFLFCSRRFPSPLLYGGFLAADGLLVTSSVWLSSIMQFITGITYKDATYSSRTQIWQESIEMIRQAWLFGNGRGDTDISVIVYGQTMMVFSETHNSMLQVWMNGGLIGFVLYIGIIVYVLWQNRDMTDQTLNILRIGLLLTLIAGMMESIQDHLSYWVLLTLLYTYSKHPLPIRTKNKKAGIFVRRKYDYGFYPSLQQGIYY